MYACFHKSNTQKKVLMMSMGKAFVQKICDILSPSLRSTKNGDMVLATTHIELMKETNVKRKTNLKEVNFSSSGRNERYASKCSMKRM